MDDLIKQIDDAWDDADKLNVILINTARRYAEEGEKYASAVLNEASAFDSEMSSGYKPSVTVALNNAKMASGGGKYIAESKMRALELITSAIQVRIAILTGGISQVVKVEKTLTHPVSSPEATLE